MTGPGASTGPRGGAGARRGGVRSWGGRTAAARLATALAATAAFLAAGCTGADAPADAPADASGDTPPDAAAAGPEIPPGVTGLASVVDGEIRFRPCAGGEPRTVADVTGDDLPGLVADLSYGAGEITVHLVLAADTVREVRVATPSEIDCERILPEGELQARGNEPFWGVDVHGEEARFRTPELLDGEVYHDGAWREIEGGWRFEASRDHVDGMHYLRLDVRPGRCVDTMSGAWYPFTSALAVGGADYEGCALEGRSRPGA